MKVFYCDHVPLPLPPGHRFPIKKYQELRERLMSQGGFFQEQFLPSPPATREELLTTHTPDYLDRVFAGRLSDSERRALGFPWSESLVQRSRHSVGGTIAAARTALDNGVAAHLAGGTHHAFADTCGGFCLFNDVVIAARVLLAEGRIRRAVVVDADVHQGDGTAALVEDDPTIFSLSIHSQRNYPTVKRRSDRDVPLPDGCDDATYLDAWRDALNKVIVQSDSDFVLYIAGADPYEGDRYGRLKLTKAGLLERDRILFERCRNADLPVTIVLGGGYARDIADVVDIHAATITLAREMLPRRRAELVEDRQS